MKLTDFTDEQILEEYTRRQNRMLSVRNKKEIKKARLGPFTYKDIVIAYPRKEQYENREAFFVFFFKQPSGRLIDIYSAISEYDIEDGEIYEKSGYQQMQQFVPTGFGEAMESAYEFNEDSPLDYEGYLKAALDYLKECGYENFIESEWDN